MNKHAASILICLITIALHAQTSTQNISQAAHKTSCEETLSTYGMGMDASQLDQHTIASVARCYVQVLDNLQAARWFEKIADLSECKPQYLLEYGQCLKSLKLYGKAKFYFQKYAQYDPVVANHFMQSCDIAKMMIDGAPLYEVTAMQSNTTASEYAPLRVNGNLVYNSWHISAATSSILSIPLTEGSPEFKGVARAGISHLRYSADARYVVYATASFQAGQRLLPESSESTISIAEVQQSGSWNDPVILPFCNAAYAVGYPALSADGSKLFFASTMPGGLGGWDLYVSTKNGNTWSKPANLGNQVNTPGNEISPCIAEDKLYFSSDWHVGLGGFDIFFATISGSAIGNVHSLGYPVNSPKDDLDFFWDGTSHCGYFASNRIGGMGFYDVYKAVPEFTEIEISVMDKLGKKPLENVMLTFSSGIPMTSYTNSQGTVTIQVPRAGAHAFIAKKEGYKEQNVQLSGEAQSMKTWAVYLESASIVSVAPAVDNVMKETKAEQKSSAAPSAPVSTEKVVATKAPVNRAEEMYFIQIAALALHSSLDPYQALSAYGDLIVHDDGEFAKVRLGTFKTETEAKLVLSRIKTEGYPDAFVVRHALTDDMQAQSSMHSTAYKVRLGTYAKIGNFNPDLVTHLGALESYRKDDLTIMLLAGFSNLMAAQKARDAAASKGFTDAYVVVDNDGVLERVK